MKDAEILSTFLELDPGAAKVADVMPLVFDACHVGVVLRAVLFVQVVVGVGAMFVASSLTDWLVRHAMLTGAALPATLSWLIVACTLKNGLARLPPGGQMVCGVLLGAVAGGAGCVFWPVPGWSSSRPGWRRQQPERCWPRSWCRPCRCAPRRARQPPQRRGSRSCRRASGRISCSIRSTVQLSWCVRSRRAQRHCWRI